MKLRPKFLLYLLLIASIPLAVSMGVTLVQSTNQTGSMTLEIVQANLNAGAESLSGYFDSRKAEIAAYAQAPLLKTMDFQKIRPFLKSELTRHGGIYEKFILGTPEGYFYNTAGGNPGQDGLRTFNDRDPDAKPKTISQRDYWQQTVGNNKNSQARVFVSDPMISYTTGAKQIVVAASIKSKNEIVIGMIGGALPWESFETRISDIVDNIIQLQEWEPRFFLVTSNVVYWYHWDPAYVVHLEKDQQGKIKVNDIGEKVASVKNITEDLTPEIALAGKAMVSGNRGHTFYVDPVTGNEHVMVYEPIKTTGYSLGMVVPKSKMMAPVSSLQLSYMLIIIAAVMAVFMGAWFLSKRIVGPILSLNQLVRSSSNGDFKMNLIPQGKDEVAELTESFNTLINSIAAREASLKESEERFSYAMQGANDGLWDWDIKKNEIYYSPRWKSMLGYKEDELDDYSYNLSEYILPEDKQKVQAILGRFIKGDIEKYEVEFRVKHKKGHYVSILSRAFAIRDVNQNAIRIVGTHTDISERQKIQTEIKNLNEELEKRVIDRTRELKDANIKLEEIKVKQSAILKSVIDSLITIDDRGIIESVNPATEVIFGYSSEEIIGRNVSMLMPEPYTTEHDNYLSQYLNSNQAKVIGIGREVYGKRKDGSVFPLDLSVSEMMTGDIKKFVGIVRDISERKQSEEMLRRDAIALKNLNEIAADPKTSFDHKLKRLLKLGLETFELDLGIISRIKDNTYVVEYIVGPDGAPPPGTEFNFEHTYCAHTYAANGPIAFNNAGMSEIRNHPCYQNFKLESYIGAPIFVTGQRYGTLNFSSSAIHSRPFTNNELTLAQLLAQWIGNELSRSQSEMELSRFKTTLDLTMDCVFMFEPDELNFFYINQGAINQVGYSYEELIHMKPYEIKPDISEQEFREMIAPMIAGKQAVINFETRHQHKNGNRIPVEIFLQYINPRGESPRFVAIVRDITERQQTDQKLNEMLDEMTLRTREITLLSSLGDLLHSCQNQKEAYEVISRFMPMLLPQLSGALYIAKQTGDDFTRVGIWGKAPPDELSFASSDCVAVRKGLTYVSQKDESALFCQHLPKNKPEISLCLPLAAQGESFGLLHLQCIDKTQSEHFDGDEITEAINQEFAETVAKQVSMAVASLRLKEQLQDQSIRDPLTELFNRRYMEETFEREIHRAARNGSNLSYIMLDVDHFKRLNDNYGHETGDVVLKELAALLNKMTRTEDIACRYGGEEFVLCLPGASATIAMSRAEEIREAMSNHTFYYEGQKINQVTVSLGVAVFPEHGLDAKDLFKQADKALYQAKEAGRNRTVLAQASESKSKDKRKHG